MRPPSGPPGARPRGLLEAPYPLPPSNNSHPPNGGRFSPQSHGPGRGPPPSRGGYGGGGPDGGGYSRSDAGPKDGYGGGPPPPRGGGYSSGPGNFY